MTEPAQWVQCMTKRTGQAIGIVYDSTLRAMYLLMYHASLGSSYATIW